MYAVFHEYFSVAEWTESGQSSTSSVTEHVPPAKGLKLC